MTMRFGVIWIFLCNAPATFIRINKIWKITVFCCCCWKSFLLFPLPLSRKIHLTHILPTIHFATGGGESRWWRRGRLLVEVIHFDNSSDSFFARKRKRVHNECIYHVVCLYGSRFYTKHTHTQTILYCIYNNILGCFTHFIFDIWNTWIYVYNFK